MPKRPLPCATTDSLRLLLLLLLLLTPSTPGRFLRPVPSFIPARNSRDSKSSAFASEPSIRFKRQPSAYQPTTTTVRRIESGTCQAMSTTGGDREDTASALSRMDGGDPGPPAAADDDSPPPVSSPQRRRPSRRYRRTLLPVPDRALQQTHAIFGTLMSSSNDGPDAVDSSSSSDAIVSYQVYKLSPIAVDDGNNNPTSSNDESVNVLDDEDGGNIALVEAVVQFGRGVDGHPGVVHGGILALVVDDVLGFAYSVADPSVTVAVTANLNVNYRLPVPSGSRVLVRAFLLDRTDRKLVFSCLVEDDRDSDDQQAAQVYCDATSVYVIPRSAAAALAAPRDSRSVSNL